MTLAVKYCVVLFILVSTFIFARYFVVKFKSAGYCLRFNEEKVEFTLDYITRAEEWCAKEHGPR